MDKPLEKQRRIHWPLVIIAAMVLVFVGQYINGQNRMRLQNQTLAKLEQEYYEVQMRNEDLRGKLEYASSKEGIEQKARELLGLVRPDEILFIEGKPTT